MCLVMQAELARFIVGSIKAADFLFAFNARVAMYFGRGVLIAVYTGAK